MSGLTGVFMIGGKGAVASTFVAASILSRHGYDNFALPSEQNSHFKDLNLPPLSQMRFASWDICYHSYAQALTHHAVLPSHIIDQVIPHLEEVLCCPGLVIPNHTSPIHDALDEQCRIQDLTMPWRTLVDRLENDIARFKEIYQLSHVIVLDVSSTAALPEKADFHNHLDLFEQVLDRPASESVHALSTSILYAYVALKTSCPIINFTPSLSFDIPALLELAQYNKVPLCGKDGKTGQTLYKTALAPMFQQRGLKVTGWYSTNILGNRDGEVLEHPEHKKTKIDSKKSVLSNVLGYEDFDHQVHIHYYKPRGDNKEAWDNIDIQGWFDIPMQMKINWLGSDSILAAPLVADLVRWMVYYQRKAHVGVIHELASYFKSPLDYASHNFFQQVQALETSIKKD